MKSKSEEAVELFKEGFNCSQSVLSAFCEKYGLNKETALKLACGFGGGMRCAEVCGAAAGGIMVIGLKYGQSDSHDKESKSNCYAKTVEYLDRFRSDNGSIICRESLGCDVSTKEGMAEAQEKDLFNTTCSNIILNAIDLLEELEY